MSTQFRLKEDWKPVGSSKTAKKLADWMNSIAKQLNRAQVVSGGTARPTDMGFRIEVDGGSSEPWTFTCSLASPVVTVSAGTIWFPDESYDVTGANVTLTGATEYVYVWHAKNHTDSGISHASTKPLSNGDRWKWVLAEYTATAGVWSRVSLRRKGDINVYLPMR